MRMTPSAEDVACGKQPINSNKSNTRAARSTAIHQFPQITWLLCPLLSGSCHKHHRCSVNCYPPAVTNIMTALSTVICQLPHTWLFSQLLSTSCHKHDCSVNCYLPVATNIMTAWSTAIHQLPQTSWLPCQLLSASCHKHALLCQLLSTSCHKHHPLLSQLLSATYHKHPTLLCQLLSTRKKIRKMCWKNRRQKFDLPIFIGGKHVSKTYCCDCETSL